MTYALKKLQQTTHESDTTLYYVTLMTLTKNQAASFNFLDGICYLQHAVMTFLHNLLCGVRFAQKSLTSEKRASTYAGIHVLAVHFFKNRSTTKLKIDGRAKSFDQINIWFFSLLLVWMRLGHTGMGNALVIHTWHNFKIVNQKSAPRH